eukprot:TRINITY_DN2742_c0_g2_i2.p3 TRINITY_DN2742_c0_g2~~TRINITY_DN2742_c0_g2_i2.p3  ORF type:complete len:118 (+),score=14.00 TRINITY_DN2742_c0_g2_i2:112-465(+)
MLTEPTFTYRIISGFAAASLSANQDPMGGAVSTLWSHRSKLRESVPTVPTPSQALLKVIAVAAAVLVWRNTDHVAKELFTLLMRTPSEMKRITAARSISTTLGSTLSSVRTLCLCNR